MKSIYLAIVAALLVVGGACAAPHHGQQHNNSPHGWHPGHVQGDWLSPDSWFGQKHQNQYTYTQYTGYMSYNGVGFNYYMTGTTMHIQGVVSRDLAHQEAHIAFDFKPNVTHVVFDNMGVGFERGEHTRDGRTFHNGNYHFRG